MIPKLSSSVGDMTGVGEVRRKALQKMGIESIGDLLTHFPRAYQNRKNTKNISQINAVLDESEAFVGSAVLTVSTAPVAKMIRRGMNILKFSAFDEFGKVEITYFNQNYLKETFVVGASFRFWGKIVREGGALKMSAPIYEPYVEGIPLAPIVPVYPLSAGLSQKFMSAFTRGALTVAQGELCDTFSDELRAEYGLCSLYEAYRDIHFPQSEADIERAKRRLCFEEMFLVCAALTAEKGELDTKGAPVIERCELAEYLDELPYKLTGAQMRSLDEICRDMACERPMRRILIGDVGSGKTAVAAGAVFAAAKSGYQCALMAPTEILAHQHYKDTKWLFSALGMNVELLTASTPAAERARILSVLENGSNDLTGNIDLIIGTHSLISENVKFQKLGLVITDEQHRFGVMQRAALASKSEAVHTLVMSATPIPRTLSLVYYGDLSVSRLDEMPPGRQRVETFVVDERYRARINSFIRTHARAGNRTYVVCPMVEEEKSRPSYSLRYESAPDELSDIVLVEGGEDKAPMKSTVEFARELSLRLPDLNIGLVHGRMKTSQKDAVMKQFCDGELDVLVATTVIEVGVNVPEATLMIVENAERFGLSQLHQLRGRVGRSDRKSFCILVSDSKSEKARRRLSVMKNTYDGYEIAEADLKLRGAGDFLSKDGHIRQHGVETPLFFDVSADGELVEAALEAARRLIDDDPKLEKPENALIKEKTDRIRRDNENTLS